MNRTTISKNASLDGYIFQIYKIIFKNFLFVIQILFLPIEFLQESFMYSILISKKKCIFFTIFTEISRQIDKRRTLNYIIIFCYIL